MRIFFFTYLLLISYTAIASNNTHIENIVKQQDAPFGVVFEILESDADALTWVIPKIKKYVDQLRKRFPDISIVVVSHGSEQFGLMKTKQKVKSKIHQIVKSLVANDVPILVCGTHASWRGVTPDDFPDYVEVTPAGPTAISHYEDMGYELVVINK